MSMYEHTLGIKKTDCKQVDSCSEDTIQQLASPSASVPSSESAPPGREVTA